MNIEGQVGPQVLTDGIKTASIRQSKDGSIVGQDSHGRYQEAVLRGNVYYLPASGVAPTAYVGAAGGTPLVAIHNPVGSGKNIVLLFASIANRVAASAAGTVSFGIWGGPSVQPTGTQTVPTNMLSLQKAGSVGLGFVNTALTGSTALSLILSPMTYYWATAAGAFGEYGLIEIAGMIIIIPGNQVAIGATSALTSATWDTTLSWEDVPV